MALYLGKNWTKTSLRSYLSDLSSVAGAVPYTYSDGKADGVRAIGVNTGSGLEFNVIPGRAMDIYNCRYRGIPLHFNSATGMTSPAYYEEPGLRWLRTFFGGLLSTCGITYCGAPGTDGEDELGLHGRIGNSGAENVCISERWIEDEYLITLSGRMREASVMGENITLTRTISTRLGAKSIKIEDVIENRGFTPQPLMMLYHFNFGFPLLSETSRIIAPIVSTEPREKQSAEGNGIAECLEFSGPVPGYVEKVFFHKLAADSNDRTFTALINPDVGGQPLGVVLRYNQKQLPELTEWKMIGEDCYVCGLEPGTVNPIGRAAARKQGKLPLINAQETYNVGIEFEVLDTNEQITNIKNEASKLVSRKL